ncbi:hypothetical protein HN236_06535 [Acinetobacter baumannii]|nr:hypothetical protein BS098_13520 [Acinetobacter baumannii]MBF1987597.1 hypothetical protein [Enterobacter asburiae]RSC55832.1 hypothetical protein EGT34_19230 [Acinetobacter sp. FDAARGOS_558]AVE55001.1 hypothetical protein AM442_10615 [Acinetobacter baumannii]AVO92004.1 hypothetical protein AM480_14740 [Acinetobacter baumannii]
MCKEFIFFPIGLKLFLLDKLFYKFDKFDLAIENHQISWIQLLKTYSLKQR